MKKYALLVLCMLLILPTAALAATTPENTTRIDESILDQYLETNGYPQEVIDSFDFDLKELLYNEKCTFVDAHTEVGYIQNEGTARVDIRNYSATFVLSKVTGAPAGFAQFLISYSWAWLFAPSQTFTDKVGFAWETGWDYVNHSQQWRYYAHSGSYYSMQSGTNYDANAITGISTKHDIISGFANWDGDYVSADSHSGWLSVKVQQAKSGKSGPDSIALLGKYFHQIWPIEGSISFGGSPSISISLPSNYHTSPGGLYTYNFNWDDF